MEESDFKATKELFGGKKQQGEKSIDDFIPKTEAEFEEFAELVAGKVTPFSVSEKCLLVFHLFLDCWLLAKFSHLMTCAGRGTVRGTKSLIVSG